MGFELKSKCGWLSLKYIFDMNDSPQILPLSLTGICNMEYSICLDPIQLIDRNVKCNVQHNSKYYNCDISACAIGANNCFVGTSFVTTSGEYPIAFSQHYKNPIITRPDM